MVRESNSQSSATCFKSAFACMIDYCEKETEGGIDFIFLTDGAATDLPMSESAASSPSEACYSQLRRRLKANAKMWKREIVVHTFGLGEASDLTLLEAVRIVG